MFGLKNGARYLLEKRATIYPERRANASILIAFARRHFTRKGFGVTVCPEQDEDDDAWDGAHSTAALAIYAKASQSASLASDEQGRPPNLLEHAMLGDWEEDAHRRHS
ncbi:MAG: hypothetical protein ABI767_00745 [Rhodanobacter sp.]